MNPIYHIIVGLVLIGVSVYLMKNETDKVKKRQSIALLIISIATLIGGIGRFLFALALDKGI
jgi:hypothetical protein